MLLISFFFLNYKFITIEHLKIVVRSRLYYGALQPSQPIILNESVKFVDLNMLHINHPKFNTFSLIENNPHIFFNIQFLQRDSKNNCLIDTIEKLLRIDNVLHINYIDKCKEYIYSLSIDKLKNKLDNMLLTNKISLTFSIPKLKSYNSLLYYANLK